MNKNKVMDAARKAVAKGQVDKAIKEYLKIVKADPDDVGVWLKIGDLHARKGGKSEATETYRKVATFYIDQGFYRKAVAVYKQILKVDPALVEINLKLAELYRQLGLLSDAMQHFEMVAAFFHREGKTTEALATIRQLVELDPDNVATRIKLAELYSKENMAEEAVEEFTRACAFLRENNRADDFVKVAERLLWHRPENYDLARELAGHYLRRNDPRRALQKLQTCFKVDPHDVQTLSLLAEAFDALDQKPKTVSVLKELARVHDNAGDREQAERVHRRVLEIAPQDPESREFLGMTEPKANHRVAEPADPFTSPPELTGRPTGSVPLVNTPPPQEPVFAPPEDDFAEELSLDDDAISIEDEAEVVAETPGDDEVAKILTETEVYVKYGLHQKAVNHIKRVFELDPNNFDARVKLKQVYLAQGREADAIVELLRLAEQCATELDRCRGFLQEVLSIDAGCQKAHGLAASLGIKFGVEAPESQEVEFLDSQEIELLDGDAIEDYQVDMDSADALAVVGRMEDFEFPDDLGGDTVPPTLVPTEFGDAAGERPSTIGGMGEPMSLAEGAEPLVEELSLDGEFAMEMPLDMPFDAGDASAFDAAMSMDAEVASAPTNGAAPGFDAADVSDEVEEAEFFASQDLYDEAREILEGLLQKHPGHPDVMAKLREVDAMVESAEHSGELALGADAVSAPAVMLENPVDDGDADTHYDLGIAYKEMGLHGEAIKAFNLAIRSPARQVQCHLMIGLCYREQGDLSEAINQFKTGLYVDSIGEDERFSLYYEMGSSYEQLGDPPEALYYYEMVHKKDPEYRDVAERLGGLKARGIEASDPGTSPRAV